MQSNFPIPTEAKHHYTQYLFLQLLIKIFSYYLLVYLVNKS